MEIRIYASMETYKANKPLYVGRVSCPEVFDFGKSLDVFRSIYGSKDYSYQSYAKENYNNT